MNSNESSISIRTRSINCAIALASSVPSPKPSAKLSCVNNCAGVSAAVAILVIMFLRVIDTAPSIFVRFIDSTDSSNPILKTFPVLASFNTWRLMLAALLIKLSTIEPACFILATNKPALS